MSAPGRLVWLGLAAGAGYALNAARSRRRLGALTEDVASLEAQQTAALGSLAQAITVQDADGSLVYVNEAAAEALGFASAAELLATPTSEIVEQFESFDEDGRPLRVEQYPGRRVLAGETPDPLLIRAIHRATGEERWRLTRATAVRDHDGRPRLAVNVMEDVTDVKQAEVDQRFLARAADAFASSMDFEAILSRLGELVVPELADRCAVSLADEPGAPPPDGESRLAPDQIVVPMASPRGLIGSVVFEREGRPFGERELAVAEELARRAGTAIENARLYTERTHIARTLQASLLPDRLPDIPGFALSSLYRPAGEENFVGGDFYEAFPTPSGWMLVVGDVTGRGAEAASLTAQARHTMRTAATLLDDPRAAVEQLNRSLAAQRDVSICTVAAIHLTEHDGRTRATIVCAGHPPPLLVRDHRAQVAGVAGPMVGAWPDSDWEPATLDLLPGDMFVVYTDGVTDARGPGERFGEERLAEALGTASDAPGAVAAVRDALAAFEVGAQADDTALVVLQRLGSEADSRGLEAA